MNYIVSNASVFSSRNSCATMPVICIGPICIPWSVIPAIWAESVEKQMTKFMDYLRDLGVPGFGKKKAGGTNGAASGPVKFGEVGHLASAEQLDELQQRSKQESWALVLDFSAPWCKPCQAIKPRFEELARQYPQDCFLEVNADDLDDVSAKCGVMGLPTFQIYRNGEQVTTSTGLDEAGLVKLLIIPQQSGDCWHIRAHIVIILDPWAPRRDSEVKKLLVKPTTRPAELNRRNCEENPQ
eukprot:s2939_g14.t1